MLTVFNSRGYRATTMDELATVPITARGERSDRWEGVQHGDLVTEIRRGFEGIGLTPKETRLSLQDSGHGLVGAFVFDTPEEHRIEGAPRMDLSCGFIHSNDSRRALHGAIGTNVSVCANGMCSGEFTWSRKHTNRLELDEWVADGVGKFANSMDRNKVEIEELVNASITGREASECLVALGRRKILSWKRVGQVDEFWVKPPYPEFAEPTAFNFYQAFNEVAKRTPMQSQFRTLRAGFQTIKDVCLN